LGYNLIHQLLGLEGAKNKKLKKEEKQRFIEHYWPV
jgi:hypothetical protein